MPTDHHFNRLSECEGKTAYQSKAEAKLRARRPITNSRKPGRMTVYRCGHCGAFHLGHKPKAAT